MPTPTTSEAQPNAAGAAIYSRLVLSVYDVYVLGFSNRFVWRCPSRLILEHYNRHVSERHLDVGVGTGYYLDRCTFPAANADLTLVDLNPNSLRMSAQRLRRYRPATHAGDVLAPLAVEPADFGSVGINYVLHCLPGDLARKAAVFAHLKPLVRPGGVIFGSTILGRDVHHNALGRALMRAYNGRGIFGNHDDSAADLEAALRAHFADYTLRVEGCVALFSGRV